MCFDSNSKNELYPSYYFKQLQYLNEINKGQFKCFDYLNKIIALIMSNFTTKYDFTQYVIILEIIEIKLKHIFPICYFYNISKLNQF